VLRGVHLRSPGTKSLISNILMDEEFIAEALQWGGRGFLVNSGRWETYLKAIRAIHSGDVWISRQIMVRVLGNRGVAMFFPHKIRDCSINTGFFLK
jgi:DNA-binding NarL/FixJ family response regulator